MWLMMGAWKRGERCGAGILASVFMCFFSFWGEGFVNLGKNLQTAPPSLTPYRVNADTSETLDF